MKISLMNTKFSHRAVAPIIATLLMVAISVVGGILIFVFAQGFFTDTSVHTPNIESLEIFGYDARDSATLRPHNFDASASGSGIGTAVTVNGAANGKLADGDILALYLRNKGAGVVTINKLTLYGTDYILPATAAACAVGTPAAGKFELSTDGTLAGCNTASPTLASGQEGTLYVGFSSTGVGVIKPGRPIIITVTTGNGAIFIKQLQNGANVGS